MGDESAPVDDDVSTPGSAPTGGDPIEVDPPDASSESEHAEADEPVEHAADAEPDEQPEPDVEAVPYVTATDDDQADGAPEERSGDEVDEPSDARDTEDLAVGDLARPVSWRDELEHDATTVIPLATAAVRSTPPSSDDTSPEVWDTGSIRRWDSSMTDNRTRTADSAMHRPYALDDREDVALDREEQGGRWYEVPLMILIALTLAFLLRTFVVQVFYIPSGSMIPTLEINDRIAVEKLSYIARDPQRGEVVVFAGDDPFAEPTGASTADRVMTGVGQFLGVVPVDAKDFVKRVIGLPGDTVVLTDGVVTVNGVQLDEPYADLDQDNGEWVVPDGSLFVLGDNRANSGDSRSSLGYIPVNDVVGRAVVTIWPLDRSGSIPGLDHGAAVDAGS